MPAQTGVTFHAGHAESTIASPLNSENWVHELLIPQVQYYPPAPTNMKKHLKVTSDEEKFVSLLCEWVLIDHGFRDRTLLPAHSLAKKSLKQLLTDPHEHSQTCFLYFQGRGIHWWRRFSCAVNGSWRKIQVQTLHSISSIHHENNHIGRDWGRWRKQAKFRVFFGVLFSTFSQPLQVCIFSTIFEAAPRRPEVPTHSRVGLTDVGTETTFSLQTRPAQAFPKKVSRGQRLVDAIKPVKIFTCVDLHVDLLVSRSIYMLSVTDFDPKGNISEVRVHAGLYLDILDAGRSPNAVTPEMHRWISKVAARHLQILHQEIFWSPW